MRLLNFKNLPHIPGVEARRARQGGSSLLEIIVATLILGTVAIGMVEFFAKGRVWFDQEERKREATLLAQESLERTVILPYAQILNWTEARKVSSTSYAITVTVTTPETDIKQVRSVVRWNATPSAQRTVSMTTRVYDN